MKEIKKIFAQNLRKEQTEAENIVWELLRNRKFADFKFRRQHVVEGFVIDFYCHEIKLGIEIDGSVHNKRKEYDKIRQALIESEGITIIRITNNEIFDNKRSILHKIKEYIRLLPNPSPSGRGKERNNPLLSGDLGEGVVFFLDRDGVINEKLEGDYVKTWAEFKFVPDAIAAIKLLNDKKVPVYIISNQSGIGRGLMTFEDLEDVHKKMKEELKKQGARIDDIFICPHAPEDNCNCRKSKPGLLIHAKEIYPSIKFKDSWFIGDSDIDAEAGKAAGCKTYKIKPKENLFQVISNILSLGHPERREGSSEAHGK